MEAAAVSRWQPPTIMRSGHDDAKGGNGGGILMAYCSAFPRRSDACSRFLTAWICQQLAGWRAVRIWRVSGLRQRIARRQRMKAPLPRKVPSCRKNQGGIGGPHPPIFLPNPAACTSVSAALRSKAQTVEKNLCERARPCTRLRLFAGKMLQHKA